ncbi:MAG: SRPBCC domain-containing protein [Chitinophagaceae bacterium]|nr:SRPBCC domain-containing protein [Chitinophagaceae bacterium]
MEKVIIKKSIDIKASKEKVWDVLTKDEMTKSWYTAFNPGTYAETDWKQGSEVIFKDGTENGMIGKIVASVPGQIISTEFTGTLVNGVEDYESEAARNIKGFKETYYISSEGNKSKLSIEQETSDEYGDMMQTMWDKALPLIKQLAESH